MMMKIYRFNRFYLLIIILSYPYHYPPYPIGGDKDKKDKIRAIE